MKDYPLIRQLESPLTSEMLEPLDPRCKVVQFGGPLQTSEYDDVSQFVAGYPEITLRVYGHSGFRDLDFLKHFSQVRCFQADCWSLENWDGLAHLSVNCEYIGLGATRRTLSLMVLARFPNLKRLFLEGHHKDITVVSRLVELEDLTLRSITLPDVSLLVGLANLWSLDIKLGGTKNLTLLHHLKSLKYLELWMIKGLEDVSAIASLESLQSLFLQALRRAVSIPPLDASNNLRRVVIETMKGLTDLQPFAMAPSLREFAAWDMGHLQPDAFRPFVGHPTLKYLSAGLGSRKKNDAVVAMFPGLEHGQMAPFQFI